MPLFDYQQILTTLDTFQRKTSDDITFLVIRNEDPRGKVPYFFHETNIEEAIKALIYDYEFLSDISEENILETAQNCPSLKDNLKDLKLLEPDDFDLIILGYDASLALWNDDQYYFIDESQALKFLQAVREKAYRTFLKVLSQDSPYSEIMKGIPLL